MDLNHIKLPATVITDLYKSSLVETEENLSKKEAPASIPKLEIRQANTEIEVKSWKSLGLGTNTSRAGSLPFFPSDL